MPRSGKTIQLDTPAEGAEVVQVPSAISALTADELAAIGMVVINSANLEATLETIILNLTGLSVVDLKIVLGRAMLETKLGILEGLAEARLSVLGAKRLAALKAILARIRANNSGRKVVVHGAWAHWDGEALVLSGQAATMSALKREPKGKISTRNTKEAKVLAQAIMTDHHALWLFAEETWPQHLTWQKVPRAKPAPRTRSRKLSKSQ